MSEIYRLTLNTEREGDNVYDAMIIPNTNSNKLRYYFSNPNLYGKDKLPSEIHFSADLPQLSKRDFLFNDSGLFIVSARILETILKVSGIEIVSVPVLLNTTTQSDSNIKYYAIRFEELHSYFNHELSDYKPSRSQPLLPSFIKKLVLEESENGFPAIFRMKEKTSDIFVSQILKEMIEAINPNDCIFESIEVSRRS